MPNVAQAERYIAQVTRIEARTVREVLQAWQQARGRLLDALTARTGTDDQVAAIVEAVALQATTILQGQAAALASLVDDQVARDIPGELLLLGAPDLRGHLRAWQAATYGQALAELARLRSSGADLAQTVGRLIRGDGRQPWAAAAATSLQLATEASIWSTVNGRMTTRGQQVARRDGVKTQRQAVAAIDRRTTACCLAAHGQIVGLDQPFHLTRTPRFAEYVMAPPFHYRCRTAITLYRPAFETVGPTTATMRAAAQAELAQR